jgi:hypothetical protein
MATVYKIEIETTSPFISYTEADIKLIFERAIKDQPNNVYLEGTVIKVTIKA